MTEAQGEASAEPAAQPGIKSTGDLEAPARINWVHEGLDGNDGSEFFMAVKATRESFGAVSVTDVAGGMRSLASTRLKRAHEELRAGAEAAGRVSVFDDEGKPSWPIFKESITREDNKDGLMRVPGGIAYGVVGAMCLAVFWIIVAGKNVPVAIEAVNENIVTPAKGKIRPLVLQAKVKLDEAAEKHGVPGWKPISADTSRNGNIEGVNPDEGDAEDL